MGISASDDTKQWREKRKIISHYLSPKQLDEKHYKVQEAEYGYERFGNDVPQSY